LLPDGLGLKGLYVSEKAGRIWNVEYGACEGGAFTYCFGEIVCLHHQRFMLGVTQPYIVFLPEE
jgi:hypothetical protein